MFRSFFRSTFRIRFFYLSLVVATLSACSSGSKKIIVHDSQSVTYQDALGAAAAEIEATTPRTPAQAKNFSLLQLNQIKPGKFKVFVFPKISDFALKSNQQSEPLFKNDVDEKMSLLGKPEEFEVSTVAENPCFQFISNKLFAKLNAKEYFDAELGANKNRRCAILEITSLKIQKANRSLIRRDDLLRTRIYLDDSYHVHGYEVEKFLNGQNTRMIKIKGDGQQSSSSGVTLFPIDIPNLDLFQTPSAKSGVVPVTSKIDAFGIRQVQKMSGGFNPKNCQGFQVNYVDHYGQNVEVGWCSGMPFPQYMENNRFIAITQYLSVRE